MTKQTTSSWGIGIVAGLFCATGAAKLYSFVVQPGWAGNQLDPVLGFLSQGSLLMLAGILEIIVGILCLSPLRPRIKGTLLLWLASMILLYRLGLWGLGIREPCNCMGVLTRKLGIQSATLSAALISFAILALVVGVAALLPSRGRGTTGNAT